jgi:glycosyltransferase involved in cell wall biosynthesis
MRVLHINAGNLYGGIETFLVTLARERGLCPEMGPHFALCFAGRLSETLESCGAAIHSLGNVRISRPWTVWKARRRLRDLLTKEPFDAVVCHGSWLHSVFSPTIRALKRPLVFWAHDAPTGRRWLERWARFTPPDLVLANSHWTAAAVPNLFPGVRCEVVYGPVPAPAAVDRDVVRRRIRAALGAPADATVILQVSRLERWKGQTMLLRALKRLAEAPNWHCWIAGGAQRPHEAEYLAELRQAAERAGIGDRVRFLGQRTDVPDLLAAADVFCQPNTGPEPFGIAFVEALYAGLPVVTTAIGGALEIVDDTCGVLTPPGDVAGLQAALTRLILEPDERMRLKGGAARAKTLCDPRVSLGRLHEVLTSVRIPAGARRNGASALSSAPAAT